MIQPKGKEEGRGKKGCPHMIRVTAASNFLSKLISATCSGKLLHALIILFETDESNYWDCIEICTVYNCDRIYSEGANIKNSLSERSITPVIKESTTARLELKRHTSGGEGNRAYFGKPYHVYKHCKIFFWWFFVRLLSATLHIASSLTGSHGSQICISSFELSGFGNSLIFPIIQQNNF